MRVDSARGSLGEPVSLRTKKFTEPGALSSTTPADLPLARTAARLRFDLLASRARCKRHITAGRRAMQEGPEPEIRSLRKISFARSPLEIVQVHTKAGRLPGVRRDSSAPVRQAQPRLTCVVSLTKVVGAQRLHGVERSQRRTARPVPLRPESDRGLLALQRSAGNAAVTHALSVQRVPAQDEADLGGIGARFAVDQYVGVAKRLQG